MARKQRSLRDCQIACVEKILNLNQDVPESEHGDDGQAGIVEPTGAGILRNDAVWKVLVFDDMGQEMISSILQVKDLRRAGVTVHLHINTTRHQIPDVPVVYLVEPTEANLKIIASDMQRGLYSETYLNFLYSIPRAIMEDFASQVAASGSAESIAQLYDQYLNFVTEEPDLFHLGLPQDTFYTLNSAQVPDEQADTLIDKIAAGLFSVMVTMGSIPVIRCPKGGPAEVVAAKLDRKLRDHVLSSANKDNLFSGGHRSTSSQDAPASRPVLIIEDRSVDLVPMLSHSWTYQSLVHDILKMRARRITVETLKDENDPNSPKTRLAYDLSPNDFFWKRNAAALFPTVAEDIDVELTKYREEASEITKKTGASSLEELQNGSGPTQNLKAAITLLPALQERKAILDMHMNIATALLKEIKDRQLDSFFQLEETIAKQTKATILDFINDSTKGGKDPMDKMRLFIMWFLSTDADVSNADVKQFEEALAKAGIDTAPVQYIKKVREMARLTMMTSTPSQANQQSNQFSGGFSFLSNRLTDRFKEGALGTNFDSFISGVKNLIPVSKELTITKITESIMNPTTASSSALAKTESYLYFDPRSANARGTNPINQRTQATAKNAAGIQASFGQRRQAFSEAIVFVVGGGSIEEYGNLQEWASGGAQEGGRDGAGGAGAGAGIAKKRIVYGATDFINAAGFVGGSLKKLGDESR